MSPKLPRDLSGERLIKLLCSRFGYVEANRVGSHAVLRSMEGGHLSIPVHSALRAGLLGAILKEFEVQTGKSREDVLRLL